MNALLLDYVIMRYLIALLRYNALLLDIERIFTPEIIETFISGSEQNYCKIEKKKKILQRMIWKKNAVGFGVE